jgi:hypothetical protein
MSWIVYLIFFTAILFLLRKHSFFRLEGLNEWTAPVLFTVKIIAAFAIWWVYTFYYTDRVNSDIWKYFDDGNLMYSAPAGDLFRMLTGIGDNAPHIDTQYYKVMNHWYQEFDNNLVNDAHIIIRFNALIRFVSLGNYHIHALIMSLLAFIGLTAIYKTFYTAFANRKYLYVAIIFLSPSLLFWSSGVMKEGLMIFSLGVIIYQFFCFANDHKMLRIVYVVLFSWLLFVTKFYVLAALIPSLIGAYFVMKRNANAALKFSVAIIVFLMAGWVLRFCSDTYDPLRILAQKQNDFVKLAKGGTYMVNDSVVSYVSGERRNQDIVFVSDSVCKIREGADYMYWYFNPDFSDTFFVKNSRDLSQYKIMTDFPRAGSFLETELLQPEYRSFVKSSPQALYRALFRPYIWEARNPLFILPALENSFILLFFVMVFIRFRQTEYKAFAGFFFSFSLLLLLVMGLTTPVLGALVRYKIAAIPFLMMGLLLFVRRNNH